MDVGELVLDCNANVVNALPPEIVSAKVSRLVERGFAPKVLI